MTNYFAKFFKLIIISSLSTTTVFAVQNSTLSENPSPTGFSAEVLMISDHPEVKATVFVADKALRKLFQFSPETNFNDSMAYEIDIGKNGGNKTKRNDHKTPEGIYKLEKKMTQPEIPFDKYGTLAFTTDYPNVFDKFESKTGSGIWLHSIPDSVPLKRGSKGCVVLRDENIKKISPLIDLNKSYLIINNKTQSVTKQEHTLLKERVLQWMDQWKTLWQTQNLEAYIDLYSDKFTAPLYNKKTWLKHKEKLKELYKEIKIDFSKPSIFHLKNQYIIKFLQTYESDLHKDVGVKTLYLIEEKGGLKILREEWMESSTPVISK